MSSYRDDLPSAIYVWLVPSEEVQDQPGSWRIRKWDTEPFPEANFTLHYDGPRDIAKELIQGVEETVEYVKGSRGGPNDAEDARRYRWLRQNGGFPLDTDSKYHGNLDAAVDAHGATHSQQGSKT